MLNPQLDLSALAEQQCRIEHKLDLILRFLATQFGEVSLRAMTDPENLDPITHEPISYQMDLARRHVVRGSSDGTKLIPPSPLLFSSPATNKSGKTDGGNNEGDGS